MDDQTPQLNLLLDLEGRHNDLLARLEELDTTVAKVLAECQAMRDRLTPGAGPASPTC
jgi:hypothetical protein